MSLWLSSFTTQKSTHLCSVCTVGRIIALDCTVLSKSSSPWKHVHQDMEYLCCLVEKLKQQTSTWFTSAWVSSSTSWRLLEPRIMLSPTGRDKHNAHPPLWQYNHHLLFSFLSFSDNRNGIIRNILQVKSWQVCEKNLSTPAVTLHCVTIPSCLRLHAISFQLLSPESSRASTKTSKAFDDGRAKMEVQISVTLVLTVVK